MEKIHAMKDGNIFRGLSALIKPETSAAECERITDDILKRIGGKNSAYEWAKLLLVKLSQQPLAASTYAGCWRWRSQQWMTRKLSSVTAALQHLVQLAASAPHVFGLVAKDLTSLVHHGNENVVEVACRITASAPSCLDGTSTLQGGIIDRLKVLCVEGTGAQAKQAARTLLWLACHGKEGRGHIKEVLEVISEAARDDELLDSNLPGVLATVSVVGQRMPALFMQHVDDIETFIVKDLMARPLPQSPKSSRVSSLAQIGRAGRRRWRLAARARRTSQAATRSAYTKRVVEVLRSILLADANDMSGLEAPRTPPTSASLREGLPRPGQVHALVCAAGFVRLHRAPRKGVPRRDDRQVRARYHQARPTAGFRCTARSVCRRSLDHGKPPLML